MPVALLLLLLGEGRRREPRRLAAEVPVALLLLLGEGRRHEPRGLAAEVPLVLLLLLEEGRRHAPRELAAEVRRLFCCCWERDDDAAPGGRFCMAKYAAISPVFAGTAKPDAARQAARVDDAHPSTHRPVRLCPPSRRGCAS